MNYLNLGCGQRYHPAWTNINFTSSDANVIAHDLQKGIPFPDESYDVVYHSHVLEHLPKSLAAPFLAECYRVLRANGVLRIAVPDLEQIVREYLKALELAKAESEQGTANYNWMMLELYDQTVRNQSGGAMASYLRQEAIPNEAFVLYRVGSEARNIMAGRGNVGKQSLSTKAASNRLISGLKHIYRLIRYSAYRRESLIEFLLDEEYDALKIGRFRQGGEIHQWMYDSYSLGQLLHHCGFRNIIQRSASDSYVTQWSKFNLDTEPDG